MMEFFEFFFSGPGWGWKVFGLVVMLNVVGHYTVSLVEQYLTYRLSVKLGIDLVDLLEEEDEDTDTGATIDDCR
jgi:hypothetical protein